MPDLTRCTAERVNLPGPAGETIPSTRITCQRCQHVVECFGQRGRSVRRGLTKLQDECPRKEKNQYTTK
jgi:hypothetical protein